MEVVAYGALTGLWWMSSASFLLPLLLLLKLNKSFRDRWFALLFQRCLKPIFEPKLLPLRKKAFDLLKENLSERDTSNTLKVLEIGIGSGANLQFYPDNCQLTALDMNANFETYFLPNQKKYPQIVYDRTITAFAEDMKDVSDNCMDVVISTYVLCSVKSLNDVLKEVKRVLKPGGRFLFLEHVGYPISHWTSTVQHLANPLWQIYFDGCCLVRHTGDDVKNAGFSNVICEKVYPSNLMLFIRPQVYGIATK